MKKLSLLLFILFSGILSAQSTVGIAITRQDNGLPIADRVVSLQTAAGNVYNNNVTNSLGVAWFYSVPEGDYLYKVIDCNGDSVTSSNLTIPPSADTLNFATAICTPAGSDCIGSLAISATAIDATQTYVAFTISDNNNSFVTQVYIDYGDGTINPFAFTGNQDHIYTAPGTYNVVAYGHTSDTQTIGCTMYLTQTIYVANNDCNAGFTYAIDTANATINFTSAASITNTHSWDINGTSYTTANVTYQATPGDTVIVQHQTDNSYASCTDIETDTIVMLTNTPPTCIANFSYVIDSVSAIISFTSTAPGPPDNHFWAFTINSTTNSTLVNPTYQASLGDTVSVTYIVSSVGCSDTITAEIIMPQPPVVNQLEGCAFINSNPAGQAKVYLLQFDYPNDEIIVADSAVTTTGGCYAFNNIAPGDYIIKAALDATNPNVGSTLPTYHLSSLIWSSADIFNVFGTDPIANKDINMITGNNPGGPGFISGNVNWLDTLFRSAVDYSRSTVILKDQNGQIITYTMANSNGDYAFSNIPLGTFRVSADYPGYISDSVAVSLTQQNPSATGVGIPINQAPLSVKEANAITAINLYPNPAADITTLQIDAVAKTKASLTIVNMLGQTIVGKTLNLAAGKNYEIIDVSLLAKGIYYISIVAGNKQTAQKLIKY